MEAGSHEKNRKFKCKQKEHESQTEAKPRAVEE